MRAALCCVRIRVHLVLVLKQTAVTVGSETSGFSEIIYGIYIPTGLSLKKIISSALLFY